MSLDVFKKARHMRRIEEYKDITISAENSALIIHSIVTVQLLDEDGKVLRSEKKSHQQKIVLNTLSEYTNITQTAITVAKQSKIKIPSNQMNKLEQRIKELIKAKQNSSATDIKYDRKRRDRFMKAAMDRDLNQEDSQNAEINRLNEYIEMLYDQEITIQNKGASMIYKLSQSIDNIQYLLDNISLMNALKRLMSEKNSRSGDCELAKNIGFIYFCLTKYTEYADLLAKTGVGEVVQKVTDEELLTQNKHLRELDKIRIRLKKISGKDGKKGKKEDKGGDKADNDTVTSLTALLDEKEKEYGQQFEQRKLFFYICLYILLNLADSSPDEEQAEVERGLIGLLCNVLSFCSSPALQRKSNTNAQSVTTSDIALLVVIFVKTLSVRGLALYEEELNKNDFVNYIIPLALHPPSAAVEDAVMKLLLNLSFNPVHRTSIINNESLLFRMMDIIREGTPGEEENGGEGGEGLEEEILKGGGKKKGGKKGGDEDGGGKGKKKKKEGDNLKTSRLVDGRCVQQCMHIFFNLLQENRAARLLATNIDLLESLLSYAINITNTTINAGLDDEGGGGGVEIVYSEEPPRFLRDAVGLLRELCRTTNGRPGHEAVKLIFNSLDGQAVKMIAETAILSLQPIFFQLLSTLCSFFTDQHNEQAAVAAATALAGKGGGGGGGGGGLGRGGGGRAMERFVEDFNKLLPAFIDVAREIEGFDDDLRDQLEGGGGGGGGMGRRGRRGRGSAGGGADGGGAGGKKKKLSSFAKTAQRSLQRQLNDRLAEARLRCENILRSEGRAPDSLEEQRAAEEEAEILLREHKRIVGEVFSMLSAVTEGKVDVVGIARKSDLLGFLAGLMNKIRTERIQRQRGRRGRDADYYQDELDEEQDELTLDILQLIGGLSTLSEMLPVFAESGWGPVILDLLGEEMTNEDIVVQCIYICYNFLFCEETRKILMSDPDMLVRYCLSFIYDTDDETLRDAADKTLDTISEFDSTLKLAIQQQKFELYNRDWVIYVRNEEEKRTRKSLMTPASSSSSSSSGNGRGRSTRPSSSSTSRPSSSSSTPPPSSSSPPFSRSSYDQMNDDGFRGAGQGLQHRELMVDDNDDEEEDEGYSGNYNETTQGSSQMSMTEEEEEDEEVNDYTNYRRQKRALPESFDLRNKYPQCTSLRKPLNQGSCGSCWAFSSSSAVADHLCIEGIINSQMAAEHSIQCDSANNGCNGGYVPKALDFMKKEGTVPLECKSYREESPRRCTNTCDDQAKITSSIKFNIQSYESLNGTDKIKSSIYNYGSVVASYKVFQSFYDFYDRNFKKVYTDDDITDNDEFITYHAIKIIGWGKGSDAHGNSDTDYWLVQNSWGKFWADGGYFRLAMNNTKLDLGEFYVPHVMAKKDNCAQFEECGVCNGKHTINVIDDEQTKEINVTCGYCLSSDQCIEIDEENKPVKGMCQSLSTDSSTCPIDDCDQMSYDPIRCLKHSGCIYCASTQKCRAGSKNGQNSGICLDQINSKEEAYIKYPCLKIKEEEACMSTNTTCIWCGQSGICLPNKTYEAENPVVIGRCDKDYCNKGKDVSHSNCKYYTSELCNEDDNCRWDFAQKKCNKVSGLRSNNNSNNSNSKDKIHDNKELKNKENNIDEINSLSLTNSKLSENININNKPYLSSNEDSVDTTYRNIGYSSDDRCLTLSCESCRPGTGCVWCVTTQSCIAEYYPVGISSRSERNGYRNNNNNNNNNNNLSYYKASEESEVKLIDNSKRTKFTKCQYLSEGNTYSDLKEASLSSVYQDELTHSLRCDTCGHHSNCMDCALDPNCGWMKNMALCVKGRSEPSYNLTLINKNFENDVFIAYQMNCPITKSSTEDGAFSALPWQRNIIAIISGLIILCLSYYL